MEVGATTDGETSLTAEHKHKAETIEPPVDATCTTSGYVIVHCACGYTWKSYTDTPLGHAWEYQGDNGVYTFWQCTGTGNRNYCGQTKCIPKKAPSEKGVCPSLDDTLTPKGEHNLLEIKIFSVAKCTKCGLEWKIKDGEYVYYGNGQGDYVAECLKSPDGKHDRNTGGALKGVCKYCYK